MHWPKWAPRWSIIMATAILVASVLGTATLAIRNSDDTPDATGLATSAEPSATAPTNQFESTAPPLTPASGHTATTAPQTLTSVSPDAVHLQIAALATEVANTPVVVRTDLGELKLTVADLGISLARDATHKAVQRLRTAQAEADDTDDGAAQEWVGWSSDPALAERRYHVDRLTARAALSDAPGIGVTANPPSVIVVNDRLAVDLGQPGRAVDADAIVDQVLSSIARSAFPIEIDAELSRSEPIAYTPELQEAVNTAQRSYGRELTVVFGELTHELSLETIASWLLLDPEAKPPTVTFDQAQVGPYLQEVFTAVSAPITTAAMAVVAGVPTVVASDGGVTCCADDVGAIVEQALLARTQIPIALPSRPAVSREEQQLLESLGIVELVGTFTTKHVCCQGRVKNIQRFADLMRGTIVEAGQSLSLNAHVGRRTVAKGFVEGGFIQKGVLVDDIGGGVSQFATTIFNALIHAGMTIDEYQTHSLYLKRYPYGLDPTISYPEPDLAFTNPTPYGLLIWPSYTDTSITVDLYSTRNIAVTIGAPETEVRDYCRRVSTDRTRVFLDGTVEVDTFKARYRPEEGRNCDGTRSVPRQCVDPRLQAATPGDDGDNSQGAQDSADVPEEALVRDGDKRADGSTVVCPPLECTERPGERKSQLPRYPDDPCLGVDLTTLVPDVDDAGEDGSGDDNTGEDDTDDDNTGDDSSDGENSGDDDSGGGSAGDDNTGDDSGNEASGDDNSDTGDSATT